MNRDIRSRTGRESNAGGKCRFLLPKAHKAGGVAVVIGIMLLGAALFLSAQELPATPVIRARVFVVNLFVTASSGKEYVRDLQKEDFSIYEDGVQQEIKYFNNLSQSKDLPMTIAMLVDTSASVSDKLQQEVATAAAFFRQVIRPNKDLVTLLEFHSEVILVQDFTDDPNRMEKALGKLHPGGNTSLYDAVYLAAEEKLKAEAGRKIIVILSDGADTASSIPIEDAIKSAQKNDVLIYGLGVRSPQYPADFGALEKFCKQTGGKFFSPSASFDELKRTFEMIMADINHQYNMAYEPKNQLKDGQYRAITVKANRKGLKLFYRQGYFAPEN